MNGKALTERLHKGFACANPPSHGLIMKITMNAHTPAMNGFIKIALIAVMVLTFFCVFAGSVYAQTPAPSAPMAQGGTIGDIVVRLGQNSETIPQLANFIAYFLGLCCIGFALFKAHEHTEYGPQKVPLTQPVKYFIAGAGLLVSPVAAQAVVNTLGTSGPSQGNTGWDAPSGGGSGGLDTMLVSFVQDLQIPLQIMITFFSFVAGLIFLIIALYRITKTSQEGPRGPAGYGTITTFIVAGLLMSFASVMGAMSQTLFGTSEAMTRISFMALESDGPNEHARTVFSAILVFMMIVGLISVVRGLFLFKMSADGNQQASLLGATSHLIAGVMLVNLGQVINMVQNTLGVTSYGILFN